MTELEMKTKLEELAQDEEFQMQLKGMRNREDIKDHFGKNGLELTEEMLDAIMSKVAYFDETGELDEETLQVVSGGVLRYIAAGALFGAGLGGVKGAVVGGVVGFAVWCVTR